MATVKVEKYIQTTPGEVYQYFTNSTALRDWMCNVATADARSGGHLYMCWPGDYYTSGEYIKLEENKFVSFTWFGRGEPHQTRVEVTLKKQKAGTIVRLAHRGLGKSKKWAELGPTYQKEWQNSLENLASVLENGADLRITRRPMLGIYLGENDAITAAKLCVPVDYGIRLEGVMDGMGAQKAGLQKDDVIISLDGQDLTNGTTIGSLTQSKQAGDVVTIVFYRGSEKKTTKMTLTGRTIPPIPSSSLELSKQIELVYRQIEKEIDTILSTASEVECSYQPGPSEWSAKEVLVHLIHSELGCQYFSSEIISGYEGAYDGFGGNNQALVEGTLAVFSSKAELLKQLIAHQAETVSMLSHIPPEFHTHKGKFWKLVFQVNQNTFHFQSHIEQIRAAIQAARIKP